MGLGLVKRFLERGNSVIATTRNPADAPLLHTLLKEQPELGRGTMPRLSISKLDTADVSSIKSWAAELKAQVPHVDVRFAQCWWLGKSGAHCTLVRWHFRGLIGRRCNSCANPWQVVVNNAGMYGRRLPLAEFEPEDFLVAFQTNTVRFGRCWPWGVSLGYSHVVQGSSKLSIQTLERPKGAV